MFLKNLAMFRLILRMLSEESARERFIAGSGVVLERRGILLYFMKSAAYARY